MITAINALGSCIDIQDSMTAEETRLVTIDYKHLNMLSEYVLCGWPPMRAEVQKELHAYWSFKDKIAIIDIIVMKGKRIIMPESVQGKVLNLLHINHMGNERTRLLACESICGMNMNADIEDIVLIALLVLISRQNCSRTKQFHRKYLAICENLSELTFYHK